jgi:hypothetical protein
MCDRLGNLPPLAIAANCNWVFAGAFDNTFGVKVLYGFQVRSFGVFSLHNAVNGVHRHQFLFGVELFRQGNWLNPIIETPENWRPFTLVIEPYKYIVSLPGPWRKPIGICL